jgi:hypothetical protein
MTNEVSFIVYEGVVVPESAVLRRERPSMYGGVPGLDEEELADPDELERQVLTEEWGPVLALPSKAKGEGIRPAVDESGGVDWGAFASADFERLQPEFDKARYKAEKLRERLKDVLIMLAIVRERLPGSAKGVVLEYLRRGIIGFEHVVNDDMRELARLYGKARRMQREICELEEASKRKREARVEAWLES